MVDEEATSYKAFPKAPYVVSSKLGTKEFWDNWYSKELDNFDEFGDEGQIWFGRSVEERILKFIEDQYFSPSVRICDLGTGNGSILRRLRCLNFTHLYGLDYCEKAVALAKNASGCRDEASICIQFMVADLAANQFDSDLCNKFDVLIDKLFYGTFDVLTLREDREIALENYRRNIGKMFSRENESDHKQFFVLVSCDHTHDELIDFVCSSSGSNLSDQNSEFHYICELPDQPKQSFWYGGEPGRTTSSAVFQFYQNKS